MTISHFIPINEYKAGIPWLAHIFVLPNEWSIL